MMKKLFFLLSMVVYFALSSVAGAANWQWVASSDNMTLTVDTDSITKDDGIYSFWLQYKYADFTNEKISGERIDYIKIQSKLKNTQNGYEIMDVIAYAYNSAGNPLYKYPSNPWQSVIPGTFSEKVKNKVLAIRADADKAEAEQEKKDKADRDAAGKKERAAQKNKEDVETAANVVQSVLLGGIFR